MSPLPHTGARLAGLIFFRYCGLSQRGIYAILDGTTMNIRKVLLFAIFSGFLLSAFTASASTADNRYLIKTNSNFWKKSFVVRNTFEGGFTADLSTIQLRMAKIFGVEVQPVKKLNVLAESASAPVKSKTPTAPVAWGVDYVYGDTLKDGDLPSGGKDVTVAILDTGVNKAHPDLKNRIADCGDFTTSANFVNNKCEDKNGHGTSVAGIVAADGGAGEGIYGLAPSAKLDIYKVCDTDGTCFADDIAVAIRYAVDQKATIVLISVGTDVESTLIRDAINYASSKGVMVIAAAGNEGPDDNSTDYPAAQKETISVGALDIKGNIPDWSSRGKIDFLAPGVKIESTGKDGDYIISSGTSMAAAHIAGLAAKEWQADAKEPINATKKLLKEFSADLIPQL
jgi:subtilisin family serine protease